MSGPRPVRAKRGWPLLVLAAAAFLPGVGLFFGAGAVTWGLFSDRPRARLAVLLGGTGALCNVAAAVALVARWQHDPRFEQTTAQLARQDLGVLVLELERYRARTGRYPATLQELVGFPVPRLLVNTYDRTGGLFGLPRPYQYRLAPDGLSYDLFATGPDGKPGTPDDVRPLLPDSVLRHSGYRPAP